jgi:hypothetical protein
VKLDIHTITHAQHIHKLIIQIYMQKINIRQLFQTVVVLLYATTRCLADHVSSDFMHSTKQSSPIFSCV